MRSALIYKGILYTALTHCQAYIKIEKDIGRGITDDELMSIECGFVAFDGIFISDLAKESK